MSKNLIRNSATVLLLSFFYAGAALANNQGDAIGLGEFVTDFITETIRPLLTGAVYIFYAVGVIVTGLGIHKFIKVSKGDPQSGPGEAAAYTFGGGALMTLGALSNYAANSMDLGNDSKGGIEMPDPSDAGGHLINPLIDRASEFASLVHTLVV